MSYTNPNMFSGILIGFIVAISVATWVYTKVMRRTGNNSKSSIITAAIFGVIAFLAIATLISIVDKLLEN